MKNFKIIGIIIVCLLFIVYIRFGVEDISIEDYAVAIGYGVDIDDTLRDNPEYIITYAIYNYGTGLVSSMNKIATGRVIGKYREDRQLKIDKAFKIDTPKIILMSEDTVSQGIDGFVNILFNNPKINDRGVVIINKGRSNDILSQKIKGYSSASEYIDGIMKNAYGHNFYSKKYTLLNLYIKRKEEGKNLALPYIELKDDEIQLSGMALFKGESMIAKLDMDESKVMNLMRENNLKGSFSFGESSDKYIDYYCKSKRKIKCRKEGEDFVFDIDVKLKGEITNNTLYAELDNNNIKIIEKELEKNIKKQCEEFIEKMKSTYKVDALELGYIAAAKYGRETNEDWNHKITKSKINVNVKVSIDKIGRGGA